eukprot:TRINITY_DN73694_c0_g1_i1.p1 TRINITY_DN73694_c0_g1~~TRINITY_DN73694_c0_g1_i1.p1  ORF type:complete len:1136 (-),score=249.39 TRINITY_DN73694_c0_g1_i1:421-3828(-)
MPCFAFRPPFLNVFHSNAFVLVLICAAKLLVVLASDELRDKIAQHDCRCWAAQGQCESNSGFMLPNCAASCAWATLRNEQGQDGCRASETRIRELEEEVNEQRTRAEAGNENAARVAELQSEYDRIKREHKEALAASNSRISELETEQQRDREELQRLRELALERKAVHSGAAGGEASDAQMETESQQALAVANARIAKLEEEKMRIDEELRQRTLAADSAASRITELEEQREKQIEESEQIIAATNARIAELERDLSENEKQASIAAADRLPPSTEEPDKAAAFEALTAANARIAELEAEKTRGEVECDNHQKSADEANARILELEEKEKEREKSLADAKARIVELEAGKDSSEETLNGEHLATRVKELEEQHNEKQKEFEETLANAKTQIAELEAERLRNSEESLKQREHATNDVDARVVEIKAQYALKEKEHESVLAAAKERIAELESAKLRSDAESSKQRTFATDAAAAHVAELEAEYDRKARESQEALLVANARISELESEKARKEQELTRQRTLAAAADGATKRIAALESEHAIKQKESNDKIAVANARITELETERLRHQEEADKQRARATEGDVAAARVAVLEAELADKHKQSEKELADAQARIAALEAEKLRSDEELTKQQERVTAGDVAAAQAAELASQCDRKENESQQMLAVANARIAELEAERSRGKEECDVITSKLHLRIDDLQTQSHGSDRSKHVLGSDLAAASAEPFVVEQAPGADATRESMKRADDTEDLSALEKSLSGVMQRIGSIEATRTQQDDAIRSSYVEVRQTLELNDANISARVDALEQLIHRVRSGEASVDEVLRWRSSRTNVKSYGALSWLTSLYSGFGGASIPVGRATSENMPSMASSIWTRLGAASVSFQDGFEVVLQRCKAAVDQVKLVFSSTSANTNESTVSPASEVPLPDSQKTDGFKGSSGFGNFSTSTIIVLLGSGVALLFGRRLLPALLSPLRLLLRCVVGLVAAILAIPLQLLSRCCVRRPSGDDDEGEGKPTRANMGLENAMYFDKEKGKWRERGKEHLEEDDVPLAPPPMAGAAAKKEEIAAPAAKAKEASPLDSLMAPPNPYALGRPAGRPKPSPATTPRTPKPIVARGAFGAPPATTSATSAPDVAAPAAAAATEPGS